MELFIVNTIKYFFIAFGVIIGGSLFGGLAAFITKQPPLAIINDLSNSLRIWAIVVALGGTFDSFQIFGSSIFERGDLSPIVKQLIYIIMALIGAYSGSLVLQWLFKGDIQ